MGRKTVNPPEGLKMKSKLGIAFAIAWAGATYLVASSFETKVTTIAQAAADQAAERTISQIRPEIDRLCKQVAALQPSFDADSPSILCNAVALLPE
jgi:hypothetical protein